ncbi:DUF4241 domain-containing protein [Streptomyces poonensis]|uniref:DUF4241 domain-containing protein n=1 Tax=Streptomyces poonensis TaxID=68255 RepID=A0A918P8B2_9ACTN|nr:DUF4241 domain-containing protein [Streptomyces poonensis]GGY86961.1 hypothetical protein GCM10010365_01130 [Streptomyces poonensis]GLJ92317.1 hypothetical protein GCM10017589_49260 [Streptomyces poonensis]
MPMSPRDHTWMFTPGSTFTGRHGTTGVIHVSDGGVLDLPTGRVAACDPFMYLGTGDAEPFTVAVEPGRYRVEAAVAALTWPGDSPTDEPDLRVAAARLVIRDEPATAWEMALSSDQDPAALGAEEFHGYGVDSGTGCFYDASADEAFPDAHEDEGPLWRAFDSSHRSPGPYLVTSSTTGHTLAAFESGWGDGAYPTWIGRSSAGEVTCFLTDFFVAPGPSGTTGSPA